MRVAKKMYKGSGAASVKGMHRPEGAGNFDNMDDYNIVDSSNTNSGTVQHTPVDEKDLANKQYVDSVATRSEIDLFLTENASDIGGYFDLEIDIIKATKENIVQSITANSTTLIASFVTKLDENEINSIDLLESGVYGLHLHAEGQTNKNLFFYCEFYKRTSGGTETLIGTTHDSGELTTSEAQYGVHSTVADDTAWVSGDRIVIKVYGRNNNNAARDVTIYMEGDTASRADIPVFLSRGFFGQWSLSGSNVYYNDGFVGIGTSEPAADLTVENDALGKIFLNTTDADSDATFIIGESTSKATTITKYGSAHGSFADNLWITNLQGSIAMLPAAAGGIAIKTLNTTKALEVNGDAGYSATANMGSDDVDFASKKYVDDNDLWSLSGSSVYRATGNVGIGTTSPQELLHVGTGTDASDISATDLLVTRAGPSSLSVRDSTNNVEAFVFASTVGGIMGTVTDDPLYIKTNNTNAISIDTSQNVGIGTDNPSTKLEVVGTISGTNIHGARESYDTGWQANSDWTNQHLGTISGGNLVHNLNAPLEDLMVKVMISGLEVFEVGHDTLEGTTALQYGITIHKVDNDNLIVQTATNGVTFIQNSGAILNLDTESWYYKVKVFKMT